MPPYLLPLLLSLPGPCPAFPFPWPRLPLPLPSRPCPALACPACIFSRWSAVPQSMGRSTGRSVGQSVRRSVGRPASLFLLPLPYLACFLPCSLSRRTRTGNWRRWRRRTSSPWRMRSCPYLASSLPASRPPLPSLPPLPPLFWSCAYCSLPGRGRGPCRGEPGSGGGRGSGG